MELDLKISAQRGQLRRLIVSLSNNWEKLSNRLAGGILDFDLEDEFVAKEDFVLVEGVKVRVGCLIWAYNFGSDYTLRELSKLRWGRSKLENSLNPWHTRPPLGFELPLIVRAQSESHLLTLYIQAEEAYYARKVARQKALCTPEKLKPEEASDEDFEFID